MKIKQLKWEVEFSGEWFEAVTPFWKYTIAQDDQESPFQATSFKYSNCKIDFLGDVPTFDEAKQLCQKHFENVVREFIKDTCEEVEV